MAKRREIMLAEILFSDSAEGKMRPCVVLSDERYNSQGYLAVSPIPTANDEYCLPIAKNDAGCELAEGSSARFDCMVRIRREQAVKIIGKISPGFYQLLAGKIASFVWKGEIPLGKNPL